MNTLPKYVVSNTLNRADWNNTTIISGDVAAQVASLKAQPGGDLLVYGSADLVDELLRHDLVDEYRLLVYPVILGSGKHLFRDRIDMRYLRLTESRTFRIRRRTTDLRPRCGGADQPLRRPVPVDARADPFAAGRRGHRPDARHGPFRGHRRSDRAAASMGDRAWKKLLEHHERVVNGEIDRWHGKNIEFTGDGVMATFDAPTRALRCAFGLVEAARGLDIETRAGIHTGEIERRETGIGGIAVHIAARVLGQADPSQVLVTKTVRDLVTGTDLAFRPLGDARPAGRARPMGAIRGENVGSLTGR